MSRSQKTVAIASTLAIAASLVAGGNPARAQSFRGTPTVIVPGSATITTAPNTTTITLNRPTAVINWASTDPADNFQPAGTTATFVNNPQIPTDFAVLNNITPNVAGHAIALNGTIIARLQTATGATAIGGTVYFFSPDGIVVGPTAVINVGNLGLTTSPIAYDANGNFGATGSVIGNGAQTVKFGQSSNALAQIFIQAGAQINAASSDGSYVAMVAPTVQNLGTINVNGNAALVAADAATITFSPTGLYNISVDVGSSATGGTAGTVILNQGTITGSAASTATGSPAHQIYLVTAPKNTLIGIVLGQGSNVGFDVAGAANVSGNSVILSAGYDITNGAYNTALAPKGTGGGFVSVVDGSFTSALSAAASNTVQVLATGAGNTANFASDVALSGLVSAQFEAAGGTTVTVAGLVTINAIDPGPFAAAGASATAGSAEILASGGTFNLNGPSVMVNASATGGTSMTSGLSGGNGTGGNADITVDPGGQVNVSGTVNVSALGFGGAGIGAGTSGGNGTGGNSGIFILGGSGTFNAGVVIDARGLGGDAGSPGTTGAGGVGTGGFAAIRMGSATANTNNAMLTFTGASEILTTVGTGGFGYPGGLGQGGAAVFQDFNGTILGTAVTLYAGANGGGAAANGVGGAAIGGNAVLRTHNNSFGSATITLDTATLYARGFAGAGGASLNPALAGGAGGTAMGGTVVATTDAGDGILTVRAGVAGYAQAFGGKGGNGADNSTGTGSDGGAGGAALGPTATTGGTTIGTQSGIAGTTNAGMAHFGSVIASGLSQGGAGGAGGNNATGSAKGNGGAGGDATGGGATLLVRGSSLTVDSTTQLTGDAIGGNGGAGAVMGNGGNALVGDNGGVGVLVTNRFQVPTQRSKLTAGAITGTANATGGTGTLPGTGTVGDAPLLFGITNSDVTVASLSLSASGGVVAANPLPSMIAVTGGTGNLGSNFSFVSSGPISVGLDTATLTAGFVQLSGSDWILPASAPVTPGTIIATSGAQLGSANNLLTYTSFNFNFDSSLLVNGNLQLGNVTDNGSFTSQSSGYSILGTVDATNLDVLANGAITVGAITTPGFVSLDNSAATAPASIATAAISAGRDVNIRSGGSIQAAGLIQAGANMLIQAGGGVATGDISAGIVNPSTVAGDIFSIGITAGGPISAGSLQSATDIGLVSQQAITTAALTGRDMQLLAGGAIGTGAISAAGRVLLANASMAQLGMTGNGYDPEPAFAATPVATPGAITINGAIDTGQFFHAATQQAFTAGAITTGTDLTVRAGGLFTVGGAIQSGDSVLLSGQTAVGLGDVTVSGGAGTVELTSLEGNLTAGRISAATDIAAIANGSLTVAQATGRDILLLASGAVQTGAIDAGAANQTSGASGRALIANASAGAAGGNFGNYNFDAVFAANGAARTGGAVTIDGTVAAGSFASYSQGAMSGQVINANALTVDSGGLVTVGQRWTAPNLTIASNDIAIQPVQMLATQTTTAGLDTGANGKLVLTSLNPGGAFVGDGLTPGQGYALSNAEAGLIQSGSLTIGGTDTEGLATTMTIGTLAITGAQGTGGTIGNQQNGSLLFVTGLPQSTAISGTIRVVGPVTAKGFLANNQVNFQTGRFELDNATGSIAVTDSSGAPAGGVMITADHIHVAAATILDKLRSDPLYPGHILDLNTAPAPSPAGPALSAARLVFAPAQTLYIQNTGSAAAPAGFLVPLNGLTIQTPTPSQTTQTQPGVAVVINGQFLGTGTTTVTGAMAYQQYVPQAKLTGIAADSQFNGCLIAANACSAPLPETTPTPDLSTQIQILQTSVLPTVPSLVDILVGLSPELTGDWLQDVEVGADVGGGEAGGAEPQNNRKEHGAVKAAIAAPAPLIDTGPLNPPILVGEPVAGGGNPALFGIEPAAPPATGDGK